MLNLDTPCEIAKGLAVKRVKGADDEEVVNCTLKVSDIEIERDVIDELIGLPVGLVSRLYDELGAPLAALTLCAKKRQLGATGRIIGTKPKEALVLGTDCEITDIEVTLKELGGLLSGTLTWSARGDEIDDVSELLGRTCRIVLVITDPRQGELLERRPAPASQPKLNG